MDQRASPCTLGHKRKKEGDNATKLHLLLKTKEQKDNFKGIYKITRDKTTGRQKNR